jgi:hypothetical protein
VIDFPSSFPPVKLAGYSQQSGTKSDTDDSSLRDLKPEAESPKPEA